MNELNIKLQNITNLLVIHTWMGLVSIKIITNIRLQVCEFDLWIIMFYIQSVFLFA